MDRAYSLFEVKGLDEERRVLRGMATTPTADRVGDIVEPLGLKFAESLPLCLHHDHRLVVGRVSFSKATSAGLPFTAQLPNVVEEGALRDRVNEAWQMVKYKLIAGVSIGFKPVASAIERLATGGMRFKEGEIFELSLVPVPANAEATISYVKSLDRADRRASSGSKGIPLTSTPALRDQRALAAVANGAVLLQPRKASQ